jgi:hypothetical protein
MYLHHALPTKCTPVPLINGERVSNGWTFFYKGWEIESVWRSPKYNVPDDLAVPTYRTGATPTNLLPEERKGHLNYKLLSMLGLTKQRLLSHDPLFFLQLILPITRVSCSDIKDDPRMDYYSKVMTWTHKYAIDLGLGGSYGHRFKEVMVPELVRYDAVLIRDGLLGGSVDGGLFRRWKRDDSSFDKFIHQALTHSRFLQLKRTWKLNDNSTTKKRGEDGYDPCFKYDYIFKVITHNVCALTERASLDLCGDETSWGHQGYGEAGSGVLERIMNKPGITKGMQTVLAVDAYRQRPYTYVHRHKLHKGWPEWTKKRGPTEVRMILETLKKYVVGNEEGGKFQLFESAPHSTWDNFFSGDEIMDWIGANGLAATMTCRRDRLPKGVPKRFFHHEKHPPDCKKARVARFFPPVVAAKVSKVSTTEGDDRFFTRVHVSMQSTSSTNFSTVNALNIHTHSIDTKERGRSNNNTKRTWGIEMNTARELYLKTYGQVDTFDSMIRRCRIFQKSFKYWHAAKNHALAMAVTIAFDMYKECLTEKKAQEFFGITADEAYRIQ